MILRSTQLGGLPLDLDEPQHSSSQAKRREDREKVLAWYGANVASRYECAKALGLLPTTVLPRCSELKDEGLLEVVKEMGRRPTGLGGTSAILRITEAGRDELRRLGLDPLSRLLRAG